VAPEPNGGDKPQQQPRELFPEWTTHPHATHTPPPGEGPPLLLPESSLGGRRTGPLARDTKQSLAVLSFLVLAVAVGMLVIFKPGKPARDAEVVPRPAQVVSNDGLLEEAARARLRNRRELSGLAVTVLVKDEVVVVSGRVPDAETREKLLDALRMTPGMKGVVDHTALEQPDHGP